ncbi:FAD-dependent oxidoreductase [uncultured Winogradskyella sp.]|uniref:FAD-dependent oxidoreductase n=1 Tax=uncultured Winogradskyella sp. TaxID=395353 RepID=UPI002615A0C8|nr:FAD-dependent oxidoreductase [uncultured Winogradskyella sp.]
MERNEFLKLCGLLGISLPFQSMMASCSSSDGNPNSGNNIPESVIIIGAGAAGMAAGHLLAQRNIDFQILEASSTYGGRMKQNTSFANFPIPLGAEWLHVQPSVFSEIVNDDSIQISTTTVGYDQNTDFGILASNGQQISLSDIGFTIDRKFVNSTWFDFFETYILPSVESKIIYNSPINSIDYSGNQVMVTDTNGQTYNASKVIVTIPVKILQNGSVNFTPSLSNNKQQAINDVTVWNGCKAFVEFTNKFYPTFIAYITTPETAGQKLYYDASYGQNTMQNILGLFAVGTEADTYNNLSSDNNLRDFILNELDDVFGSNIASSSYIRHTFQNWNSEPYANGAYIFDYENSNRINRLGQSVNNKLFFAGDAYTTGNDWSSVHAAARSAKRAVEEILS